MNFLHEKDLGDIILSLASVQAAGGGNYYIKNNHNALRMLAPLIEYQPYINECAAYSDQNIDKSFVNFRNNGHPFGVPLAKLHADWICQQVDFSKPWIHCPKDNKFNGKIIVNKTSRYCNNLFPWFELINIFKDKILFVGTNEEYKIFCGENGQVERLLINNYLELAIAINSSECFIGNQSSANCVAEGLKHQTIQEVCLRIPDCIYKRDNATFCCDGNIDVVLFGKRIQISVPTPRRYIDKTETPPGGWRLNVNGEILKSYSIGIIVMQAQSMGLKKSKSEIEKMIVEETTPFIPIDPITEQLLVSIQKVKKLIE
jgi:hypothetical protein